MNMNAQSIVALAIVGVCFIAAVAYLIGHKGGCGCSSGGSCSSCASCGSCSSCTACSACKKKGKKRKKKGTGKDDKAD